MCIYINDPCLCWSYVITHILYVYAVCISMYMYVYVGVCIYTSI